MLRTISCISLFSLICCVQPDHKKIQIFEAKLFLKTDGILSEGPVWSQITNEIYWVDIEKKRLHVMDPSTQQHRSIHTPLKVSMAIPVSEKLVLVGLGDGLYSLDLQTGNVTLFSLVDHLNKETRLNDGKCDPGGKIWVGTTDTSFSRPIGKLFMVSTNNSIEVMQRDITISNGMTWSADSRLMYYIDTPTNQVRVFDYDRITGAITNRRVAINIQEQLGSPDGMTIDSEGKLWIALWGGGSVGRFDPLNGNLIGKVDVPARNVTSCVFGGRNLDSLFITTASTGMNEKERKLYPDAGSVFVVTPGVRGVAGYSLKQDLVKRIENSRL